MSAALRSICTTSTFIFTMTCIQTAWAGPPQNDNCAGAVPLPCGVTLTISNAAATPPQNDGGSGDPELPTGSPTCQWNSTPTDTHHTVWYSFVASDTSIEIETCNTTEVEDTIIAVYDGTCGNLTEVTCGEDGCGATGFESTLCFDGLTPGNTYLMVVGMPGSFAGFVAGEIILTLACPCPEIGPGGDALQFADETSSRLVADPVVGVDDVQEKDYAWGDVDQDGDIDLVCVRKEPFNTFGRFRNVLFMNEGTAEGHAVDGVLVDRTADFATDATDGGQGLLDLTNDRDVVLVDVNDDTWLDIVTATTYGEGLPKTVSHPRVYINKGTDQGLWQGFRYEENRTPTMPLPPNFCGIGVGDVTGDDLPDLYFTEYNNDLEDRLWINDGTGAFTDESAARMTTQMLESDFGVHAVIADMNGDGVMDVVKDRGSTATMPPLRITISYNDPLNEGLFDTFDITYNGNPYFVQVGDLNNDDLLDIVIDDDGIDRYLLNQGNDVNGLAVFQTFQFPPESNLFGGNIVIDDLNKDGFNDVVIADVDVDCCGCPRNMHIWRNQGDLPNVTFVEDTGGIPISARTGTHDVAVFDINGDSWLDMVIGTCSGTSVYINQPPIGMAFNYPDGLPGVVPLNQPFDFLVQVAGINAQPQTGTGMLHYRLNGAPIVSAPMAEIETNLYQATLPAADCFTSIEFYVSAQLSGGGVFTDPPSAPAANHAVTVATGTVVRLADDFESVIGGWTVSSESLLAGEWERADPNGTLTGAGQIAAPDDDAQPEESAVMAFVTDNGPPFGAVGDNDVDGGPTHLISPTLDLGGSDAIVSYSQWFFCDDFQSNPAEADVLTVAVSNDGGNNWFTVRTVQNTQGWEPSSFHVGEYVAPSSEVWIRFSVSDQPNNSITEAGLDDFRVEAFICETPCACAADLNGDNLRNGADVQGLVDCFVSTGTHCNCADMDGNATVAPADIAAFVAMLLSAEPCPP